MTVLYFFYFRQVKNNFKLSAIVFRFVSTDLVFVRVNERHHTRSTISVLVLLHSFIDCRENRNFEGGRSAPNFN